ncbi:hypothetical protein ACFXJ6_21050 [Streptomyces sp. NPDC059218]|uniref:hypothetical protein n=1 Tax=unclassified Streptomyces TaxID=2593676 RepID=UPI0036815570
MPNATAQDDRLSHMARGVLVDILSHRDGWETTADDMWRASVKKHGNSPGRRPFRAAFAELKAHGYLVQERVPLDGGQHGTVLIAYDLPVAIKLPEGAGSDEQGDESPDNPAGQTDVPDGGTSGGTDVPDGGTSGRPGEIDEAAGHTDVPDGGTSGRPGETNETAGHSDVPHGGTSSVRRSFKTGTKTEGYGRRPTTGSGGGHEGGSAASNDTPRNETQAAAIGCVIGLLPPRLRDQLPTPIPQDLVDTIRAELGGEITSADLVARAERRWLAYGYDLDSDPIDGPGILRPVGVALTLIRARACSSPRCNDGTDLDTGVDCRTCEREAEDRRAAAGIPVQGAFLTAVPSGPDDDAAAPQEAAERSSRRKYPLENCDGCDRGHRPTTPGKLCATCRVEQRVVNSS